jgi:hypothetical protein
MGASRATNCIGGDGEGNCKDGSIMLDVKLNIPPELETAQTRASQGRPHMRQFVTTLPPAFGDGKPQEISSAPGNVRVMIRQVRDDFLHPDVRPTLFDTHRLGAASDVFLKGHSARDDKDPSPSTIC